MYTLLILNHTLPEKYDIVIESKVIYVNFFCAELFMNQSQIKQFNLYLVIRPIKLFNKPNDIYIFCFL